MNPAPPVTRTRRTAASASVRAAAPQDRRDGLQQDLAVQPEGRRLDVLEIQPRPFVEAVDFAAPVDLPQAGDARFDAELAPLPEGKPVRLLREGRPRADQAHVALEHAVELRQLIQAVLTKKAAQQGDAGIVSDLEGWPAHFVARKE